MKLKSPVDRNLLTKSGSAKQLTLVLKMTIFIFGLIIFTVVSIYRKSIPSREETVSLIIFMLGCGYITASVDLSLIIGAIKDIRGVPNTQIKHVEQEKDYNDVREKQE